MPTTGVSVIGPERGPFRHSRKFQEVTDIVFVRPLPDSWSDMTCISFAPCQNHLPSYFCKPIIVLRYYRLHSAKDPLFDKIFVILVLSSFQANGRIDRSATVVCSKITIVVTNKWGLFKALLAVQGYQWYNKSPFVTCNQNWPVDLESWHVMADFCVTQSFAKIPGGLVHADIDEYWKKLAICGSVHVIGFGTVYYAL